MLANRLWELIEPLLAEPAPPRGPSGQPRIDDRAALEGILFVLSTGCRLARPTTAAWLRLRAHGPAAPARLAGRRRVGPPTPTRARRTVRCRGAGLVAGVHQRGVGAREKGGRADQTQPTDRSKHGSKYHVLCDANGLPLHALISGANTHDSMLFEPLLDTNPAVHGRRGHPGRLRRRPDELHADKGYDYRRCRAYCTGAGSRSASRGAGPRTRPSSAGSAGSSSAPSPGCCGSSASGCGTTGLNAPSLRCSPWPWS